MELFMEVFYDALGDTLRMLPFLFAAYLLMELLEQGRLTRLRDMLAGSRWSPAAGAVLGLLPQCGFSAAAANLYNRATITQGTLLAVLISTSDEALPMLLANPQSYPLLLRLLAAKLVLGTGCGMLLDALRRKAPASLPTHCGHHHPRVAAPAPGGCATCGSKPTVSHTHAPILLSTLRHTASIGLFVFVITLVLGGVIELLGSDTLARLLMTGSLWQPFAAGLVGFIPNCAASILLTQLLLEGSLSFGAALAGLTTGAGAGLLVLVRGSRDKKQLAQLLLLLYGIGVTAGVLADVLL